MSSCIVLFGPPGVGKGTYARLLVKHLGLAHVSTGQLIRDVFVNHNKNLYKTERQNVASGELVDDEFVTDLLQSYIHNHIDPSKRILLDGYPRKVSQIKLLESIMKPSHVLSISLRRDLLMRKLLARRTCKSCGRGYNIESIMEGDIRMPAILPKIENICDDCGDELIIRNDDKEELVRKRLDVYDKTTAPVLDYYEQNVDKYNVIHFNLTSGVEDMMPTFFKLMKQL